MRRFQPTTHVKRAIAALAVLAGSTGAYAGGAGEPNDTIAQPSAAPKED